MADRVYMRSPDGKLVTFDKADVNDAIAGGYTLRKATGAEASAEMAAQQPLTAAAEGFNRGVTFGFGDLVTKRMLEMEGKTPAEASAEMLARSNTGAGMLGDAAGTITGAVVTPAVKGVGLAGKVVKNAAAGAGIGLGQLVSEDALENRELSTEALTTRLVAGALTGGVLGAAFHGIGKGSKMALDAAKEIPVNKVAGFLEAAGAAPLNIVDVMIPKVGLARKAAGYTGKALKYLEEKGMLDAVANKLSTLVDAMPDPSGVIKYPLMEAGGKGAAKLFALHEKNAAGETGPAYLAQLGLAEEDSSQEADVMARTTTLGAIQDATRKAEARMDRHVDGFFSDRAPPRATAAVVRTQEEFKTQLDRLRALVNDPTTAFAAVPAQLQGAAPGVFLGAASGLVNSAQFLVDRAPKDPNEGLPKAVRRPWAPSQGDMNSWFRYVDAVANPGIVLEEMKSGAVPREHSEVLRTLYPTMYDEFKVKMTERIQSLEKPLSYQKKLALSQLLGPEVLGLTPQRLQILQSVHVAPPPQKSTGPDGRQDRDVEKSMQTQAQRLESR